MHANLRSLAMLLALASPAFPLTQLEAPAADPPQEEAQLSAADRELLLESFEIVWRTVNERYFDPTFGGLDWQELHDRYRPLAAAAETEKDFYLQLNRMLFELNVSHLGVVPPDDPQLIAPPTLMSEGSPGFDLRLIGGRAVITSVRPGSVAEAAGLRPSFIIQAIDGTAIAEVAAEREKEPTPPLHERNLRRMIIDDILRRLYGDPGTSVVVEYKDDRGETHTASITRQQRKGAATILPNLPPTFIEFEARRLAGDIGYLRFNCFHPALLEDLLQALASMSDSPGLIIDLRGNPGGTFPVRKALAEKLIRQPTLFWTFHGRGEIREVNLEPMEDGYRGPVAVLVDIMSGSSSEELAGALQAIGRALIVGERTAGRALIAEVTRLPNGATFIFPIGETRTADGTVLEGRGVIPDIEVELDRQALLHGTDTQLDAAVMALREQAAP